MCDDSTLTGPGGQGSAATLVDILTTTVARMPDAPALCDGNVNLSYSELLRRATAVAIRLQRNGVRPGDRVAVWRERGADTVVAVLGILLCGAAHVCIDVSFPAERRATMLTVAGVRGLITDMDRMLRCTSGVPAWSLTELAQPAPTGVRLPQVLPSDLACVMFTSGSTGSPKAIMIEHRGLVAVAADPALPRFVATDRVAQVTSISFDVFHLELWRTVAAGAQLVVLPDLDEMLAGDVGRELHSRGITVAIPPTMVVNHLPHVDPDIFSGVRLLLTAGDVLQAAACRRLLESSFGGQIWNMYGPTETTTVSTAARIGPSDAASGSCGVTIGRALAAEAATVRRADLSSADGDEEGELYLSGIGLARGYLRAPALTAERFLPDPDGTGTRMYRTGDRAVRPRSSAALEFRGRSDSQLKILGYRVEPAEVESALLRVPGVHNVAVVAIGNDQDRMLGAAIDADPELTASSVHRHAARLLPSYEVPRRIVLVDALPVTNNGKRDFAAVRRILASSEPETFRSPADDRDGASNRTAERVGAIWRELLGAAPASLDDDFFDRGGNSLLALRLRARLARETGLRALPGDLVHARTYREFVTLLSGQPGPTSAGAR